MTILGVIERVQRGDGGICGWSVRGAAIGWDGAARTVVACVFALGRMVLDVRVKVLEDEVIGLGETAAEDQLAGHGSCLGRCRVLLSARAW